MGMFKRLFTNTSHRLMAKLGAQRGSHQLVCLAGPEASAQLSSSQHRILARHHHHIASSSSKRSRKRHQREQQQESMSNSFEAEMMAAISRMPALKFHQVHGPNAELSPDGLCARRTQSFCQAIVFSERLIMPNERVYVRILDIAKGWNGTIRFGFTACDPETFRYEMPKHACPDMTNAGHTWAHALADELVRRDTVIHFSYNTSGYINYGINNHDCGVFVAKAKTSEPLWFIIDIYGLTTAVELVDPRAHNWNNNNSLTTMMSSLHDTRWRHEKRRNNANKSITSCLQIPNDMSVASNSSSAPIINGNSIVNKHTNSNKHNRNNLNSSSSSNTYFSTNQLSENFHSHTRNLDNSNYFPMIRPTVDETTLLPNLNSLVLPSSEQNIYTSMPLQQTNAIDKGNHSNNQYQRRQSTTTTTTTSTNRHHPQAPQSSSSSTSASNCVSSTKHGSRRQSSAISNSIKKSTSSRSPSSANMNNDKINTKSNHSSISRRDRNDNNSPNTKDCPICFERPINCVLYQCGHMCTCYECGVKQWRTQSRTCPICRTVIKDVIKTYLS